MNFADVSPLRGVLQGGCAHALEVAFTVVPQATQIPHCLTLRPLIVISSVSTQS